MKLYGDRLWISPYFFSVYVSLRELGLPFEVVEIALERQENQRGPIGGRLPTRRIPALETDGFALAESAAIIEYLDEEYGGSGTLLPRGRIERARARMLMGWLRSDVAALRDELSTDTMFYVDRRNPRLSAKGEAARDRLFEVVEEALVPGAKAVFSRWTICDSEISFMLHRLLLNGIAVPERLANYARLHWNRPSARDFVARVRPSFVEYYTALPKPTLVQSV